MKQKFNTYTLARPRTRKFVGWILIVFGIVGVILPVVPGWVVIIVGFEILGIQLVFTNKLKLFFLGEKAFATEPVQSDQK